jgi:hypothetical protein
VDRSLILDQRVRWDWAWLARQPGRASAALLKQVEQAARESIEIDAARDALDDLLRGLG